jgi:murein DD-endopeptidase MepM/ murein hydrolase activator NlpD
MQRIVLVLAAWLSAAAAAPACDLIEADQSPLETRKPVRGDDVRLAAGFGLRMHPILGYQRLHTGVDWAAPLGTPVIAAGRGRVSAVGLEGEYGNRVIIDHGGAWETVYAQLSAFSVRDGDCVEAGTVIGSVGATGLATSTHVHFEVRRNGKPLDPMILPTRPQGRARKR